MSHTRPRLEALEGRTLLTTTVFADGFGSAGGAVTVGAVAMDAAGNSYVTGGFTGAVSFGPVNLTSAGNTDVFVAKLNTAGNVVWAVRQGSASTTAGDFGNGIAVDGLGNVYVTGVYTGGATFGTTALTNAGGLDAFVEKLDGAGNVVWATGAGGAQDDQGRGVAVDGSGNVFSTGGFTGSATFGPYNLSGAGTSTTGYIMKQDPTGGVVWAIPLGGNGTDSGYGVATDTAGNVYTVGSFTGQGTFGGVAHVLTSRGSSDVYVAKLATTGNLLWATQLGGAGQDDGTGIAVDGPGNVSVTGDFTGTATFGGANLTSAGLNDAYVARLDTGGSVIWAKGFGGAGADAGLGIAVDAAGNVYDTGYLSGAVNFGGIPLAGNGGFDAYAAKLDATGNVAFAQSFGSAGNDLGLGAAVGGPNSNVTVAGSYAGAATVGTASLPASGTGFAVQLSQATITEPQIADFDGVGHSQLAVFRPSTAQWIVRGPTGDVDHGAFGATNYFDIPVPGDYDGVGHTELAIFRPSTAQWIVRGPSGDHVVGTFGATNFFDVPPQTSVGSLLKLGKLKKIHTADFSRGPVVGGPSLGGGSGTGNGAGGGALTASFVAPRVAPPLGGRSSVVTNQGGPTSSSKTDVWSAALDQLDD